MRYPKRAFTLVELLVVVAIISLLGSLILSAIIGARTRGLSVKCRSNLKQIGMAHMLWLSDHDGIMVPTTGDRLHPTVPTNTASWLLTLMTNYMAADRMQLIDPASVANCPSRKRLSGRADWWNEGSSYGLNSFNVKDPWNYRYSNIERPSQTILVAEIEAAKNDWAASSDGKWAFGSQPTVMAFRHGSTNLSNVLFADGRAAEETYENLLLNPPLPKKSLWKWW